jgi:hypothetical protein
MQVPL